MSEYIIEIPDECFASYDAERDVYYPDERDSAMRITPIVRCRDCKYRHEGMCMLTDGMGDFKRWFVDDDDYCSDGEKAVGE